MWYKEIIRDPGPYIDKLHKLKSESANKGVPPSSMSEVPGEFNRLKEWRYKTGLSVTQMSYIMGLHFTTIARHEVGKQYVNSNNIFKYGDVYGVSPCDIMLPEGII